VFHFLYRHIYWLITYEFVLFFSRFIQTFRILEEADKDWMMIRLAGGWMFLLVPAHPGSPGQRAAKRLLCCCNHQIVSGLCIIRVIMFLFLCILTTFSFLFGTLSISIRKYNILVLSMPHLIKFSVITVCMWCCFITHRFCVGQFVLCFCGASSRRPVCYNFMIM